MTISKCEHDDLVCYSNSSGVKYTNPDCSCVSQESTVRHTQAQSTDFVLPHRELIRFYVKDTLKDALLHGGIDEKTINFLVSSDSQEPRNGDFERISKNETGHSCSSYFHNPAAVPVSLAVSGSPQQTYPPFFPHMAPFKTGPLRNFVPQPYLTPAHDHSFGNRSSSMSWQNLSPEEFDYKEITSHGTSFTPEQQNELRTLRLSNLSDRTTHKDLISILRGGRILDVHIRDTRSACVSFAEGASDFFTYSKRNDFYLNQKRVEIRWNDHQFHLNGHVASKVAGGATRNLVIRGGASKLNEQDIRDDMDHIHNLVIIDVFSQDNDIFVSTNSIHNALFARTCMMSRAPYKGLKIEWYPDECAAALPQVSTNRQTVPTPKPAKAITPTNRFSLLNLDEGSEDGHEDADLDAETMSSFSAVHSWTDTSIVA